MRAIIFGFLVFLLLGVSACSGSSDSPPADGDTDTPDTDPDPDNATDGDTDPEGTDGDTDLDAEDAQEDSETDGDAESGWEFDREDYAPVNGWILLDPDPDAIEESILAAAEYGVNHIQLSHDIIMNIEDILSDDEEARTRVERLNLGISLAHQHGMKAYIWAHEFSPTTIAVCYAPDDPIWETRAQAYRDGLAKIPDVDGVILMFGSAPTPPWLTACTCDWCEENYEGNALTSPPGAERVRLVVENVGGTIVNELGKELFIRTFVHETSEIAYHSEGLATAENVAFVGMHKGPVQDWQPYNPHHPCIGNIGPHPGVLELDVAGEYFGRSVLPFCAPGYYWYRLRHAWNHMGIGAVIRVQRGSAHALGTPNEVNIRAITELMQDFDTPLESIWDGFIQDFYDLPPENAAQPVLKRILKTTFPVRRKSHYVLGVWALEKSSELPTDYEFDQFSDRGDMPKWDADWEEEYNRLKSPDKATVARIWQEASEAVALSAASLTDLPTLESALSTEAYSDLRNRLVHQHQTSRAWRAVKLYLWARRAGGFDSADGDLAAWMKGAREDLENIRTDMETNGWAGATVATSGQIAAFLSNTDDSRFDAVVVALPSGPSLSPLAFREQGENWVEFSVSCDRDAVLHIDYGTEIPDYGQTLDVGSVSADTPAVFRLENLERGNRYVLRARAEAGGVEILGGDYWAFIQ